MDFNYFLFYIITINQHSLIYDNTDFRRQLEKQKQNQETNDSKWRFDMNISSTKHFHRTTRLNGSSYVKLP